MEKHFLKKEPYSFYQNIEKELMEKTHQEIALDHHVSLTTVSLWSQAVDMKNRFLEGTLTVDEITHPKGGRNRVITEEFHDQLNEDLKTMTYKEIAARYKVHVNTIWRWASQAAIKSPDKDQKKRNREEVDKFITKIVNSINNCGGSETEKKYGLNKNRIYLIIRMCRALDRI